VGIPNASVVEARSTFWLTLNAAQWTDPDPLGEGTVGPLRLDYRERDPSGWLVVHLLLGRRQMTARVFFDRTIRIPVLAVPSTAHWSWWEIVMSFTPNEWLSHWPFVRQAEGHVLIGGLGLGMVVRYLQEEPTVTRLTVIERDPHVVRLIRDRLNAKVDVIVGDFWEEVRRFPDATFDSAWVDIWNEVHGTRTPEHRKAEAACRRVVKKGGVAKAWMGVVPFDTWCDFLSGSIPSPYRERNRNARPTTLLRRRRSGQARLAVASGD